MVNENNKKMRVLMSLAGLRSTDPKTSPWEGGSKLGVFLCLSIISKHVARSAKVKDWVDMQRAMLS